MTSTATAPAGGQIDKSAPGAPAATPSRPSAFNTHSESARPPDEYTPTGRGPRAPALPTPPGTCTDPAADSANGADTVSSSITGQPTSSPARPTNSTNP